MNYKIICACSDLGLEENGTDLGPTKIVNYLNIDNSIILNKPLCHKSHKKEDLQKNIKEVNIFNTNLYNEEIKILQNNFPITIGGDHSIAIASSLASRKINKNIGIIWIDAHLDYNTFNTTITGNLHGLPLASINGLCKELTPFTNEYINQRNTVVIGYRANEINKQQEINNIINNGGNFFTYNDIEKEGIENIMQKAFLIASNNTNGVHISFDLDVINPLISPGVSVKEENGLNYEEVRKIIDIIKEKISLVKSFDLVEYNPLLDKNNKTLTIASEIINTIINCFKNNDK